MECAIRRNALIVGLVLAVATPVVAHHSYAIFDMDKDVTYKGTVLEVRWTNPHAHFIVQVDAGPGIDPATVGTWDIEGASTNIMGRQGWTRATLKAGDPVTVVARPMKDGAKGAALFYIILPDGRRLYMDVARPKGGS
jgi:hypothetical protein